MSEILNPDTAIRLLNGYFAINSAVLSPKQLNDLTLVVTTSDEAAAAFILNFGDTRDYQARIRYEELPTIEQVVAHLAPRFEPPVRTDRFGNTPSSGDLVAYNRYGNPKNHWQRVQLFTAKR